MIKISHKGDFKRTAKFLKTMSTRWYLSKLEYYGQMGVEALRQATPKDTGRTSESWFYEIQSDGSGFTLLWNNRNVNDGVNIAIILQYGHGTGTGGYVQGIDYINPALRKTFQEIADALWKEVQSA